MRRDEFAAKVTTINEGMSLAFDHQASGDSFDKGVVVAKVALRVWGTPLIGFNNLAIRSLSSTRGVANDPWEYYWHRLINLLWDPDGHREH
jgi:hypothetical protein